MGDGSQYICSKCGKKYHAFTGIGFLFPNVYERTLKDIKEGKYGEEWQKLSLSEEMVAVDAEDYLYVCEKCGHWKVDAGLSLYVPKNKDKIKKKQYGIKTVEEWGEIPYATIEELKRNYNLLKGYVHTCEKCGEKMHKATREEEENLPCPDCGGAPKEAQVGMILWD